MMVWIMVKQPMIDHDADELPTDSDDDKVEDSSEA